MLSEIQKKNPDIQQFSEILRKIICSLNLTKYSEKILLEARYDHMKRIEDIQIRLSGIETKLKLK